MSPSNNVWVSRYPETNVRVPTSAWDALEVIRGEGGLSRDATVRRLLAEHVARQVACEPEERLTHIATLLRHPRRLLKSDPPVGRLLRLRVPLGLLEEARSVSYRLPGQPEHRGHHDYQARLLTDAVVTAIAVAAREPLVDEVLEGLLPLLRHQATTGLWWLAVAATAQGPELEVYKAAEPPPSAARGRGDGWLGTGAHRRAHYVADALRDDVSWHGDWRRLVLEWLARRLLVGDDAAANERMLFEQRSEWGLLRHDLENTTGDDHDLLRGLFAEGLDDLVGRSGAVVWRAQRKVDLQEFECWVMGVPGKLDAASTTAETAYVPPPWRAMSPPGWTVDNLGGWRAIVSGQNPGPVPEPWATHVAAGRVLRFQVQGREVLWPVVRASASGQAQLVDGIEVVLAAASRRPKGRTLSPVALVESILLRLDHDIEDWRGDTDSPDSDALDVEVEELWKLIDEVHVPVHTAHRFGLIDTATRDDVVAQGRARLRAEMSAIASTVPGEENRQALVAAMNSPTEFMRITKILDIDFTVSPVTWVWPVRSLADEVLCGTEPEAIRWLSNWVIQHYALGLERSMEQAWHRAFQRFQPDGDGYVTSTVIDGALLRSRLMSEPDYGD